MAPFEFSGGRDTCVGCAAILHAGDTVASVSDDRPDWLLCVGCLWLRECDLSLPRWSRASTGRTNLAGVFRPAGARVSRTVDIHRGLGRSVGPSSDIDGAPQQ